MQLEEGSTTVYGMKLSNFTSPSACQNKHEGTLDILCTSLHNDSCHTSLISQTSVLFLPVKDSLIPPHGSLYAETLTDACQAHDTRAQFAGCSCFDVAALRRISIRRMNTQLITTSELMMSLRTFRETTSSEALHKAVRSAAANPVDCSYTFILCLRFILLHPHRLLRRTQTCHQLIYRSTVKLLYVSRLQPPGRQATMPVKSHVFYTAHSATKTESSPQTTFLLGRTLRHRMSPCLEEKKLSQAPPV